MTKQTQLQDTREEKQPERQTTGKRWPIWWRQYKCSFFPSLEKKKVKYTGWFISLYEPVYVIEYIKAV